MASRLMLRAIARPCHGSAAAAVSNKLQPVQRAVKKYLHLFWRTRLDVFEWSVG